MENLFIIIFDSCDCGESITGYIVAKNGVSQKVATIRVDSWEEDWKSDALQQLFYQFDYSEKTVIFVNF